MTRTTNGTPTRACASGTSSQESRRSSGGLSRVIRKPKPTVTAEVPSGSISSASKPRSSRPARRVRAAAASPPTSSATTVASGGVAQRVPRRVQRRDEEGAVVAGGARARGRTRSRSRRAVEGARGQHAERQQDQQRDDREHAGQQRAFAAARPVRGAGRVDQPQRGLPAPHRPGVHGQDRDDGGELQQRQHGGGRQVEDLRGLPVDLHLQGGVRRPAEDLDDAEGGEGEQEHHHGGRGDRRGERGQRHPAPGGRGGSRRASARPPPGAGRAAPTARRRCGPRRRS